MAGADPHAFQPLIGGRRANVDDNSDDRKMLEAARYLERWLPTYTIAEEEFGLSIPDCVETVLINLPELIEYLESQMRLPRKGGPSPDGRRLICAGVCAEIWRRHVGEMQPFSPKLQGACEEYWRACGNPETSAMSNLKNWERFLVRVKDENDEAFREDFDRLIVQFSTT
jgi:hypothetical protein